MDSRVCCESLASLEVTPQGGQETCDGIEVEGIGVCIDERGEREEGGMGGSAPCLARSGEAGTAALEIISQQRVDSQTCVMSCYGLQTERVQ
jgi:hypothetical protein